MIRVAHLLGPSAGGMRRHVRYLAAHPPDGIVTAAVCGPASLGDWFQGLPFRAASGLRLTVSGRDADVIHAHGLTAGTATLVPGGPPVVVTLHLLVGEGGRTANSRAITTLARLIAKRADALVAVSDVVAEGFPQARVIAPASEALGAPKRAREEVRAALGAAPSDVVAITVARLHPDKDLDLFIRAVQATGAVGWLVGEGPERDRLTRLASGSRVRMLGHRTDVADLLAAADVFCLTSRGEGYGIAVVEALTAGLPVVATRTGALPALVADAGVLAPPGDPDAYCRALNAVVSDEGRRAQLRSSAAQRPLHMPDPRDLVERLGDVYRDLVGR